LLTLSKTSFLNVARDSAVDAKKNIFRSRDVQRGGGKRGDGPGHPRQGEHPEHDLTKLLL